MGYLINRSCRLKGLLASIAPAIIVTLIFLPIEVFSEELSHYRKVIDEIRHEVSLKDNSSSGRPLPLAAHWNAGFFKSGFTPAYQVKLIKQGHHILPWFHLSSPLAKAPDLTYYKEEISFYSENKLPISFVSTQWEHLLSDDPRFNKLDGNINPNVIGINGKIVNKVSPFSLIKHWEQAGSLWTENWLMNELQNLYPNPPKIIFVSNNEHKRMRWYEAYSSRRFIAKHGLGKGMDFIRKDIGDRWIVRYRALQAGMKNGLKSSSWKNNLLFVGYNAYGGSAFGRWLGWVKHSLYSPDRLEPWPLAWDGASVPFYVHNWDSSTDYNLMGPQVQSMNWVFMLEEAYKLNPNFWFEISTWDGHEPKKDNDKRKYYARIGQQYDPARYEGMVQFGMWLLRPRVVREFRGWTDTVENSGVYFDAVMRSVDRVYKTPLLEKFWRNGSLVVNKGLEHPFQSNIPSEYANRDRWFLLDNDINKKRPWSIKETTLDLFPIALVVGKRPNREWLIYVNSPVKKHDRVGLTLPSFGSVLLQNITKWGFYHISERDRKVKLIVRDNEGT